MDASTIRAYQQSTFFLSAAAYFIMLVALSIFNFSLVSTLFKEAILDPHSLFQRETWMIALPYAAPFYIAGIVYFLRRRKTISAAVKA